MGMNRAELERLNLEQERVIEEKKVRWREECPELQAQWDTREAATMMKTLNLLKKMRSDLELGPVRETLDVGCGMCRAMGPILEVLGGRYTGIDFARRDLDVWADDRVWHYALEECPITWNRRFDVIYANHVLEHCSDVRLAVTRVKQLLAPGGILGVVTPHLMDDAEPTHLNVLNGREWIEVWSDVDLWPVYLEYERHHFSEMRMLLVHREDYPVV